MKGSRIAETLLMTGFVLAAMPFTPAIRAASLLEAGAPLFLGSLLLVSSIYATNSYFGYEADRLNARLSRGGPRRRGVYAATAAVSLPLGLLALHRIDGALPYLGAASYALWFAYSMPSGAKGRPVWGTVTHFFGQMIQFHLGIVALSRVTPGSLAISVFFAFVFAGGHLMHELKDFDSDLAAGVRTGAVVFGRERIATFYRRALALPPLYWGALYLAGILSLGQFIPFFAAATGHLALGLAWNRERLKEGDATFQLSYRGIYLAAGIATFAAARTL